MPFSFFKLSRTPNEKKKKILLMCTNCEVYIPPITANFQAEVFKFCSAFSFWVLPQHLRIITRINLIILFPYSETGTLKFNCHNTTLVHTQYGVLEQRIPTKWRNAAFEGTRPVYTH